MVINEYGKQYFLYAKGWYKNSGDIWEDLNKLHAIHYLIDPEEICKAEILNKVKQCAFECILDNTKSRSLTILQEFMEKIDPEYWVRKMFGNAEYDYKDAVLQECLSLMRFAVIDNLIPEKDCDFNILPPSKEVNGTLWGITSKGR